MGLPSQLESKPLSPFASLGLFHFGRPVPGGLRPGHCRCCGQPVSVPHARGCPYLSRRRARATGREVRP